MKPNQYIGFFIAVLFATTGFLLLYRFNLNLEVHLPSTILDGKPFLSLYKNLVVGGSILLFAIFIINFISSHKTKLHLRSYFITRSYFMIAAGLTGLLLLNNFMFWELPQNLNDNFFDSSPIMVVFSNTPCLVSIIVLLIGIIDYSFISMNTFKHSTPKV